MNIKKPEFMMPGILTILFGIVFSYIGYLFTKFYIIFGLAIIVGVFISIGGSVILSWSLGD